MKRVLLALGIAAMLFISLTAHAQSNLTLKDWKNSGKLADFPGDVKFLDSAMTGLTGYLNILKEKFDMCRKNGSAIAARRILKDTVSLVKTRLENNINKIKKHNFYGQNRNVAGTSFLYAYAGKELEEYLKSLESLSQESRLLFNLNKTTDLNLNVFDNANFLNAYYNMTQSRSALFAAIGDLERYYQLGGVSGTIADTTTETKKITGRIDTSTKNIDTSTKNMSSLLTTPFVPYFKVNDALDLKNEDKISSSANAILKDSRRNWWWRTLIGGLLGGITAGIIVRSN